MKYNFDVIIDRRNCYNTIKWNPNWFETTHPDPIPMWIADMDIPTPDFILDAMKERLEHPFLGYADASDEYFDSIIQWQRERFGLSDVKREHVMYHPNLLGAIDTAVEAFTEPGDAILLHVPAYHMFHVRIESHPGRTVCALQLKRNAGRYEMDFAEMEEKIVSQKIKLAILCSPHNPTGQCWTRSELEQFADICHAHGVIIVADEIHSDIVMPGESFVSIMDVSERARECTISLRAPGKTFNIAGQPSAYSTIFNPDLQEKLKEMQSRSHYGYHNCMSLVASTAAYTYGGEWTDQLMLYLQGNDQYIVDTLHECCPSIKASVPEATYFMWLDFSELGISQEEIANRCNNNAGVIFHNGVAFGRGGEGFMRCNTGCPRAYIVEAMDRICKEFG